MATGFPHRVVIVGGGFAGLNAARHLGTAPAQVTLVDRRNVHVFQPLLYQVATGGLSPGDIASPLRRVVRRHRNTTVWLGEVAGIDVSSRRVRLADGAEVEYDTLVIATGAENHYFGHETWRAHAPSLKTLEDATEMRRRILLAFEAAEREPVAARREAWLTFVVVGGGPTGVELAGALGEVARDTLRRDFRAIDPASARVLLVEATDRLLPLFPPGLSQRCARSLERLGVTVRTETVVTEVAEDAVTVVASGRTERIATRTLLWAAGVRASPLGRMLAKTTRAELDRSSRVVVGPDLTLPGHPEIFVAGDLAHCADPRTGGPLPGVAPVALQQGAHVARAIRLRLAQRPVRPFRYRDKGQLATIGRAAAVADLGRLQFSGYPAWLLWLFIHLMYLVEFENRLLVFVQWAWNYLTWDRGARIIGETERR
jgi:NADH dehydrogenase